jgi:nucleotidyltransferase/DNA polymerase involved in DNA repair
MDDLRTRIWPLAARKVNGIGPRASERLVSMGINTVGDLAATDPGILQERFGRNYADWLARIAQRIDERPVVVSSEPKSVSRETTFERDMHPKRDRAMLTRCRRPCAQGVRGANGRREDQVRGFQDRHEGPVIAAGNRGCNIDLKCGG